MGFKIKAVFIFLIFAVIYIILFKTIIYIIFYHFPLFSKFVINVQISLLFFISQKYIIYLFFRSVVVNGSVEHVHSNGQHVEYRLGDCFGVQPIAQTQYNDGEIRTLADDCEFILVRKKTR